MLILRGKGGGGGGGWREENDTLLSLVAAPVLCLSDVSRKTRYQEVRVPLLELPLEISVRVYTTFTRMFFKRYDSSDGLLFPHRDSHTSSPRSVKRQGKNKFKKITTFTPRRLQNE